MPSDLAYWLVSTPLIDHDPSRTLSDIKPQIEDLVADSGRGLASLEVPQLKSGTLNTLLTLSESLPKTDSFFTTTVSKLLDTLRTLLGDDAAKLESHTRVNDRPLEEYLFPAGGQSGWKWDRRRWSADGKVVDVVESLNKELTSIDNIQKSRLQSYNLAKGHLTSLQRKMTGNLSTKSLTEIVKPSDVKTGDSEFLETIFVAVPTNNVKDWHAKYERLAPMVVPRSSSQIAKDDDFVLFSVTVFKKTKDEFLQKSREAKFIARDFSYDPGAVEAGRKELERAQREERELYSDMLRLTRTNFSEAFQLLVHLKVARLFVESVLRYGLPAEYAGIIIKPDTKTSSKLLKALAGHYTYLRSKSDPTRRGKKSAGGSAGGTSEEAGEWATVLEEELEDFVFQEVGRIV